MKGSRRPASRARGSEPRRAGVRSPARSDMRAGGMAKSREEHAAHLRGRTSAGAGQQDGMARRSC